MKTHYFKVFCASLICLFVVLLCRPSRAAGASVSSTALQGFQHDTTRFQKPGRLKRHPKIKDNEEKEQEDGVDNNVQARSLQEFYQRRDPKLNRVPVERLLNAREKRDLFLQNVKRRPKTSPVNFIKTPGNAPVAPVAPPPSIAGLQWQERGPNNVGGRTRALMFDKADSVNGYKRVFAGGVDGGLWVTSDITATTVQWTKINDFLDNLAISCITQNPANPKEIYAGTGEGFLNGDAVDGLGVWKSTDGGVTWTHLASTATFKFINAILVDRNSNVYIAGETDFFVGFGVDKSTDGGSTWTNVITSSEAGADLQLAANGDIYASTGVIYLNGHIYISDFAAHGANTGNAGTWTNITPASNGVITPATTSWDRIKLALAPSDANVVYAFMETDQKTTLGSVQVYNKATNTWTVRTVPSEAFGNGQAWYSIAAAVDPNNSSVLYAGSLDAERSTDGGQTWTQYSRWDYPTSDPTYVHADHHAYVYFPGSSGRLMMGTDGGVFYTTNANATPPSFINRNNGYNVTQFYSVALHPTNYNYALAGSQDNGSQKFSSAGIGPTTVATGGDGADVFIDQTNGNIQITSYVYDQYYLSTNNGASFNALSGYGNGQFINPTDYDPSTKTIYAGSSTGYYYRATSITTSPAYSEVGVPAFGAGNVNSVTVAPITANRVYFGLDNGNVVRVDNAQTGTSNTGVVLKPNGGIPSTMVSSVAVDPTSEDHILVTYSNYGIAHVFETKNASAATPTWTDVSGNLPDMPVRSAVFYPGDPTKAIIATELGVWTTDLINGASTTWDPSNTGLANVEVDMLKYRAADQTIAAATHGRGLFTANLAAPTLSALTASTGTLSPAFSTNTLSYTEAVPNATTQMTVTPTATSPTASITVNGTAVTSGSASGQIALKVGANVINIVVTANGNSQTYAITVTRAPSTNALLATINLNPPAALTVVTGPGYANYTTTVAITTNSITVKATEQDATATLKINGVTTASGVASAPIALSPGANVITIVSTAQDGVTTKTYIITVTKPVSANLSALSISAGTLSPAFVPATTSYTASVANAVTSITITPTVDDPAATVKVNGTAVTSGTASGAISLSAGANAINIVVTGADNTTTKTYTVTVTRAPSTNAVLATINLNPAAALTVVSGPGYANYTTTVALTTNSITIKATEQDPTATLKINGVTTASGVASAPIALNPGANVINIVSTAQDGVTTKTYILTVTKPVLATLSALSISAGTLSPAFATGTISYTASVANAINSITVTPTVTDPAATVTVNGTAVTSGTASGAISLSAGANAINIVVTGADHTTTKTYTVTVTRAPSTNAVLATINLNPAAALTVVSGPGYANYTTTVAASTSSITIKATAQDPTATLKINGVAATSGVASAPIALSPGSNVINIVSTAQDGVTTKTYIITVTKLISANLAALSISAGTLSPAFATGTISYTESVLNAVNSVTVTPTTVDASATVKVNGTAVTSGTASQSIPLSVGPNTISIVVTGADNTTTKTYTITITRAPSTDALLATINLNPAAGLTVVAGPGYANYTTTVAGTTNSITITATEQDATATLKINGVAATSGSPSAPIALSPGANVINIVSTAQDGVTTKTYIITITKPVSANLSALSLSAGTLSPAFATGTISYTANVLYAVNSVTVTPTTIDATATVKVNGTAVTEGTASQSIPLNVGQNTITIVVTGQDGTTTKTYTATVTRSAPSTNALLATINLTPAAGLTVVTGPGYANYTTTVANATSSITITATEQDPTATLKINGVAATSGSPSAPVTLAVGANVINIVSTAQDGVTTKTYIITVTRAPSTNAVLATINLIPAATLTVVTGPSYANYTTTVAAATSSITIKATEQDPTATLKINGVATASGVASAPIALAVGANVINIVSTAQDGVTTKTYTITATRPSGSMNNPYEAVSVTKPADNVSLENDGINVHQEISPNGDGINDYLMIEGITNYPQNKLTIIDRNGILVYQTTGYDNATKAFDGHSNEGKMQQAGTYFYSLDYTANGESKRKTGYIILKY